ncbi:hypothetical protein, partial [Streptomyces sp. NPDC046161]|uniref:hypothetical protein n=1 Tax=Streptomyces sp. NPDC046161 TaxID=3155132 RepID=UPI003400B742
MRAQRDVQRHEGVLQAVQVGEDRLGRSRRGGTGSGADHERGARVRAQRDVQRHEGVLQAV